MPKPSTASRRTKTPRTRPTNVPRPGQPGQEWAKALNTRLRLVFHRIPAARLAEMFDWDTASIRRYRNGATPPPAFIARLCFLSSLSADWLLNGLGPRCREQDRPAPTAPKG